MNNIIRQRAVKFIILLPVGIIIFYVSSFVPDAVEKLYSQGIYRFVGQGLSLITGILPFSTAEIIVVAFFVYILYRLFYLVYSFVKREKSGKQSLLIFFRDFIVVVSILYFAFVLTWGLNYQRSPFSKTASFSEGTVSIDDLTDVCRELINRSNEFRAKVAEDERGVMKLTVSRSLALENAYKGYDEASRIYPLLGGKFGRPKGVLLSKGLSLLGIGGVYFPFTAEANVNMDTPDSMIPFNICHELAHQRGFAREDEANFIGYVTCISNPDMEFKYSGYVNALVYAMNALYDHDRGRFNQLRKEYSEGIVRDLNARKIYWQNYEGTLDRISSNVNNAFLKANMQQAGIESYGRMVDLLIYQYRTNKAKSE